MTEHALGKLHADYLRWHPAQVASGDIDPVYPVLRVLGEEWDLDREQLAWLVFCHVIWYHPGSTLVGFQMMDDVSMMPNTAEGLWKSGLLELPCETERRGHRPKQPLINHMLGLRRDLLAAGGAWAWAQQAIEVGSGPKSRWLFLNAELMKLTGNGRWAAYKTAEMLQKVCGLPVEAPDAGHRYSSGPRKGLAILEPNCPTGQDEDSVAHLDFLTELWADLLGERDIAQVETSLCDFNSLVHGRYYLGHDIDSMQHAFRAMGDRLPAAAWEARRTVFGQEFLGELNNWTGVRKDLNKLYKTEGRLAYVD